MKHSCIFLLVFQFLMPLNSLEVIQDLRTISILTPSLKDQKSIKIRLDNGLEAYIVSDPDTDKTGAVLTVMSGGFSDPPDHPGMAHFLEHMLFLGTEEYPEESEYQRYIKDHGGAANAFTTAETTTFLFTIDPDAFDGAISRFASFFKTPLFSASGVSREMNAIEQEYAKNVENESFRDLYVHYDLASPEFRKKAFYMGNSKSLANTTREELKKWYESHYSADNMRLAVVGKKPLNELQQIVIEAFKGVPKREVSKDEPKGMLTNPTYAGKLVYVEPLRELRTLTLTFEAPEKFKKMLDTKPYTLICNVLGDESEFSLLNSLKKEGLAESLECGDWHLGGKKLEIFLQIGLTAKGAKEWETVLERVFQAIANFKDKKLPLPLFEDLKKIQMLEYQFQSRENLFSGLMKQGLRIAEEPMATYPERSLVLERYDEQAVMDLLSYLSLQNMHIYLKAPKGETPFKADLEEPWLKVRYGIYNLPPEALKRFEEIGYNPDIDLPPLNHFLPNSLKVLPSKDEPMETLLPMPERILDEKGAEVYYAKDNLFKTPKASLNFLIHTKLGKEQNTTNQVLLELYLKSLEEVLNPMTYPAKVAGMDFEIKKGSSGILMSIEGYSDSVDDVLQAISENLQAHGKLMGQFENAKEILSKEWANYPLSSPVNQGIENLKALIYKDYSMPSQKLLELKHMTKNDYQNFISHFFDETFIQGLIYGNLTKEKALAIAQELKDKLVKKPFSKALKYKPSVLELEGDKNPAYLQLPILAKGNLALLGIETAFPFSFKKRAGQQFLSQSLSEPFFSELRTKQQTGYIVQAFGDEVEKALFQYFLVQSSSHSTESLLARFELFIETFLRNIDVELSKERFENLKKAAIYQLDHPAKNLDEMGKLLALIYFQYDDFKWLDKRLEALNELTYEEFLLYAKETLSRANKRRLAILLNGKTDDVWQYQKSDSLESLKNNYRYTD